MQQRRFDAAGRLMHTFRGMAGTLGIRPLAHLAAEVERAIGGDEAPAQQEALVEQFRTLVATTLRDIAHVAEALQQALPMAAAPSAAADAGLAEPADMPSLRRSLDELTSLLRGADMRALEVFEQLQQTHAAHVRDTLQPLDEAMATLDFDRALAQCQALKMRLDK